jgi:signal transduction histidine kinase
MFCRAVLAASILSAPLVCSTAEAQTAARRTVLVVHARAESVPANSILDAGLRQALTSRRDLAIDYFAEYLQSDLFPGEQLPPAFRDYLRQKYQGRRIDVVIAISDAGARFVLDYRAELFPDAPVVLLGLTAPDETTRRLGGGIAAMTVAPAYLDTLRLALALHPSTRRVFVVANGPDARMLTRAESELRAASGGVPLLYLSEATIPRLISAVKAVPPDSLILYIGHAQHDAGNIVYSDAVARLVAEASAVPVYGTSDLYIGSGVVGGVMRRTSETGARVGEMAVRILTGTPPQDIPLERARVMPIFDARQLERWSIPRSRLPPGAQIDFREPSVWERYRFYIIAALTALIAQATLIGGLLVQDARRRRAEAAVWRSQAELRKSYERVRDLGSRLLDAQEHERARIARELHDDISQQLAVLKIELRRLTGRVQGASAAVATQVMKRTDDIARSVHDLSHRLHPARLRLTGLVPALEGLRSELSRADFRITFSHANVPATLSTELGLSLYRIVQEALQNAAKHSQARTVSVELRAAGDGLTLTIVDDGVGFDVGAGAMLGIGLISVRERVEAVNGTFDIRSHPGEGTALEVRVRLPLPIGQDFVAAG